MRFVISEFISLDGVVQGPGGPDEDTFELVSAATASTGVQVCRYRRAR